MRILIAMLIVLVVLGMVAYLVVAAQQIVRRRQRRFDHREPWEYIESSMGGQILFFAEKTGCEAEKLAEPLKIDDPDFVVQLYSRRNEADEKLRALNDKERLLT